MLVGILIILIIYTIILKQMKLKKEWNYMYFREIPTQDTPSYVGKIVKGRVNGNDIISTILDLSHRGYITILTEKIKNKNKRILYLQKNVRTLELQEHETFLINQIFKNSNRVIFDDYIKSSKFKQDFKAFDKMLDRRIGRKSVFKNSILKNINKIIFLTSFFIFGVTIFYSIFLPIIFGISKIFVCDKQIVILNTIGISSIIFILIAYKYISYINKSTSIREILNLNITYIVLIIIFGISIIIEGFSNIKLTLYSELVWYEIFINWILSVVVLLYIFNIIKHDEKREYWCYFFIIISLFSIILNFELTMCINIIFFATYLFFKAPKHTNLKEEDFIYKWNSFKKYLEDYSMLEQQEENAIMLWEKYLIYAISLGVNKKIIKHYSSLNNIILIDDHFLKRFYIEYVE